MLKLQQDRRHSMAVQWRHQEGHETKGK